ncbi:MAG TPA: Na/Pi cotransporter family protein [Syntrophales bacterium]|nr:Na/Pi cotransporter family protein [Syntrophales bacterium]HRT71580.1 Na/Pi cotransporter family protein [Syntrophales bacterium]
MSAIFLFLTGLSLFLYGMVELSALMRERFNNARLRENFKYAVRKPVYGLVTGVVATVLFQSSTATSLLVVGMVSAGLMSFYRSLSILLGADIGTVFTVQLVVWKVTDISPLLVIAGGLLWALGKDRWKPLGEGVFYFGLMFFGLSIVSGVTAPLKDNPDVVRLLRETGGPLTGLLAGVLIAALVHSSAIPISILVILAQYQMVTTESALPIVFGANVGTAVTAIMASIVTNVDGRRSALSHLLFKVFGTAVCFSVIPVFVGFLKLLSADTAQQIAYGHLLFNLVTAGCFIFLLRPFSRLVEYLLPGKADTLPVWPEFLDARSLAVPEEALECVRKELHREMTLARSMFLNSVRLIDDYGERRRKDIMYVELVVDNLRNEVSEYLRKVSAGELSAALSKRLFSYAAMVDDIERIADHSVNIVEFSRCKHLRNAKFSPMAEADLAEIIRLIDENLRASLSLLEERDEDKIRDISLREDEVDRKVKEARERHLERFHKRICQAEAGPIFVELLVNLERISDHCQNIADYVAELEGTPSLPAA